jgi:hypothetical protein
MRVLSPIIQISALSVLDAREELTLSDAIASQLVSHNHPRHILQPPQQASKEALRCLGIAPGLNEDVEHNAILIDGAPEIVLHALDPNKDFVHVPLVAGPWPATAQAVGETRAELLAPASHRLVGDDDTTFRQDQLDIPQAEAEHVVQPHGMADDLSGEPMTVVGGRAVASCRQSRPSPRLLPDLITVTMPVEYMDGDGDFSHPTLVYTRVQRVANHLFPSPDGRLGAPVVA